jgi:HEAT repeat protein
MLRAPRRRPLEAAQLRSALASWDPIERIAAIGRAARRPDVEEALIEAASDADPQVRRAVARALGRQGTRRAVTELARVAAEDSMWPVRAEAIAALGTMLGRSDQSATGKATSPRDA